MSHSVHERSSRVLTSVQQELGELLSLAMQRGTSCHLQGDRQQVQPLLHQLEAEFRSAGRVFRDIRLAGLTRDELPRLLADQFGFGLPSHLPTWEVWQQLGDFLSGSRQSETQSPCLWSDLELLDDEMLAACARLFHMNEGLGPHILLTESTPKNGLKRLLHSLDLVELRLENESAMREQARRESDASLLIRPAAGRPVPVI